MSKELHTVSKQNLLAIGFPANFHKVVYGNDSIKQEPVFLETPFQAIRSLEENLEKGSVPHAILFDYEVLEAEGFRFIDFLRKHEVFRLIPVIGIANQNKSIDISACLQRGIDDVYNRPVSWSDLFKRVELLNRYKSNFVQPLSASEKAPRLISIEKRVFDIVFASGMILVLSPVMLFIALCIRLGSKGPIIYKSKRVGTGYQVFHFLKFRSMVVDADEQLKKLAHLNQYADRGNSAFVKLTNDPRITKIGKIIRKTSLDELPQLFNVLRGEMSIVGNRPLPLYEAEEMVRDAWAKRFLAPAGLTGLWQVTPGGKDNLSAEERVGLDIEYAEKNNFWMDMKILSKTLPAMIQKES